MTEELKDLIEKIQEEGIKAAQDNAKEIEEEANRRANSIIKHAQQSAEERILDAKKEIAKMEQSGRDSLKQAGRDLLLTLRKEINVMLGKLILSHVHKALSEEELAKIIAHIIRESKGADKKDIAVSLKKEDLDKIEKDFFGELKEEIKKGIILKPSEEIRGGFVISYDKGKSYFDFTNEALTEYISSYLKPKLAEILNEKSGNK